MNATLPDDLPRTDANHVPLGPVAFVERAGEVYASRCAVIRGTRRCAWREVHERSRRLVAALRACGIGRGVGRDAAGVRRAEGRRARTPPR